ncbi:hypothetical protein HMPREF9075_00783, partial [Capnocytophaga sp. oral taxon 332 str. F0381]
MIICKLLIVIIVLHYLLLWVKTKTLPKFFIQYYFHLSPIQNSKFKIPPFPLHHTLWQTFKVCQSFSGTFPPKVPKVPKVLQVPPIQNSKFTIQNSPIPLAPHTQLQAFAGF